MATERIALTRAEAIKAYKEARDEADLILVGYMLENPSENLSGLCKDADPDNWNALRTRVQRRLEKARSEGGSASTVTRYQKREQQGDHAKRFFNNPAVVGERKAEIVAEALADDYVAEQVAARITGDPDLMKRVEKARKSLDKKQKPETAPLSLTAEWHNWLTRLNSILTEGARLAERTEVEADTSVIPTAAKYAYELITEKKIDAEFRELLESEGVH